MVERFTGCGVSGTAIQNGTIHFKHWDFKDPLATYIF
jgi:hypothetical protein